MSQIKAKYSIILIHCQKKQKDKGKIGKNFDFKHNQMLILEPFFFFLLNNTSLNKYRKTKYLLVSLMKTSIEQRGEFDGL